MRRAEWDLEQMWLGTTVSGGTTAVLDLEPLAGALLARFSAGLAAVEPELHEMAWKIVPTS